MLINGIELKTLGVQLYDRVLHSNRIETSEEWLDGDIQPTFIRQQDKFKNVALSFLVLGQDEEDAFIRISKLTKMLKKAAVQFDDLDLIFNMTMVGQSEPKRLKNGNFIVDYNLTSDYAQGSREIYTTNANLTNSFKMNILYYQDSTKLLSNEIITIYASSFDEDTTKNSLEKLGINLDKFLPKYYNNGIAANLNGVDISYESLQSLQTLIINYTPIKYNFNIRYFMGNDSSIYETIVEETNSFTYPQLQKVSSIGQLVNPKKYQPEGYRSKVDYNGPLEVESILKASPISVYYDKIENEKSKNVSIFYKKENDEGEFELIESVFLPVKESEFYEGLTLKDLIPIDNYRPEKYYDKGYVDQHFLEELITYDTTETKYDILYPKSSNTIYLEYHAGIFPDWYRLSTISLTTKYQTSYDTNFTLESLNIDLNKYQTAEYMPGKIYNSTSFSTYDDVINAGVIQIYYTPIEYPVSIRYFKGNEKLPFKEESIKLNATRFFNNPILSDIININQNRPENFQFSTDLSYSGEVTLAALIKASPINIFYEEIEVSRTKNVLVKYKQELSSALSTITTILITVNESDCIGGTRLRDIIGLNKYKPDYYENGILDGHSSTSLITFDEIAANYEVVYLASSFTTPVRYYVDAVDETKWLGSESLSYKVIDFTSTTTLYDLGLDVNGYKPSYCENGIVQYNGPVNFTSLRELKSIDIIYKTVVQPEDPSEFDYPHRFLFLQHNDLGGYENLHPEWTMNHSYINTGISAEDMSKLTVSMECARVDENVPLDHVNEGYAYLFGSSSPLGEFFMRFNNQTQYGSNLTGVNTYEAKAGHTSDVLVLKEESAKGFSSNSGIYSSDRPGYSYATFTYTHNLATEHVPMTYPLYLFANNDAGTYRDGLGGIGIYSCRIYYDNKLIRDMIPVQFYDKIGDQVAPSNCLYDKVTKTFFEDGSKTNSFNIIDDDRYQDTNPEHQIGHCYVKYYRNGKQFKTVVVYFRGSDFINTVYDPYTAFDVEGLRPPYSKVGRIDNYDNLVFDFDNMNNNTYRVDYEAVDTHIEVNYYKQEADGSRVLLATDDLPISEKDFYQAPTFGDIVRLNKYKPDGYKTDFVYEGNKVSLTRVLDFSPYEIVYVQETEPLKQYKTKIKYIKKVFGIRQYEIIGTKELVFDQTNFRDGEYIDFYFDKNLMKPARFYKDGTTYQWYEMDERLTKPENLKPEYTIMYDTTTEYVDINYYTESVAEENKIASTTWAVKLDDFNGDFQLVDMLPNKFINKYKPTICNGGQLQNPSQVYTFESLIDSEGISIVYSYLQKPHDPEQANYEPKILYFGKINDDMQIDYQSHPIQGDGACIPFIDLGYKPKELSRLRVELTGSAQTSGFASNTSPYGLQTLDSTYWFGYWGNTSYAAVGTLGAEEKGQLIAHRSIGGESTDLLTNVSPGSKGCFGIRSHIPEAGNWAFTAEGPQNLDGVGWHFGGATAGQFRKPTKRYYGIEGTFRNGFYSYLDDNYEEKLGYYNYKTGIKKHIERCGNIKINLLDRDRFSNNPLTSYDPVLPWTLQFPAKTKNSFSNPFTIILDAYNNYMCSYDYATSNFPNETIINNKDNDIFENREQPKGTLSLFRTTNPTTGQINIEPKTFYTYPYLGFEKGQLGMSGIKNPYGNSEGYGSMTEEILQITGKDENDKPIYSKVQVTRNIKYANFPVPINPQILGAAVWRIKIYDRNRMVRDLIPVAKGDKLYDYVMPEDGLFDLVTEIFFGNNNQGGKYSGFDYVINTETGTIDEQTAWVLNVDPPAPDDWTLYRSSAVNPSSTNRPRVLPIFAVPDILSYGKIVTNYYDYNNSFIANQFVNIPTWFDGRNTTIEDLLAFNDFKPDDFHLNGFVDLDTDISFEDLSLEEIYKMGAVNIYYKLRTFTKTVVYYKDNVRVGSKDLFYSIKDIDEATTLTDLGIDVNLYQDPNYKPGRIVFDESILAKDDIKAFIDAPSPIVVYDKFTKEEKPNLLYVEYYRESASDDKLITLNSESSNYLDCNLTGKVLNPNGATKYYYHYHDALYEDEKFDYFIPYQARVINPYVGIHYGPARRYMTLAMIVTREIVTILEERNGWGRLKEYPKGWILLSALQPMTGPGQNPEFDEPQSESVAIIPFEQEVQITKMTIDRLWCYIPAQNSWVKAEDISYDQAGRLYNGLKIQTIDLDKIDFTTVTKLSDMNIYPNQYKLRFHENAIYPTINNLNYETFSELHSLDFVYPETVFTYNCIYYKDKLYNGEKAKRWVSGRGIAQMHDPNFPDVDWAYHVRGDDGEIHSIYNGEELEILREWNETMWEVKVINPRDKYWEGKIVNQIFKLNVDETELPREEEYWKIPSCEVGRAAFSCSISDWNPDWDLFIETSWKVDSEGQPIAPTIYRDTPIQLSWSFFGIDRNLFRPKGYPEGFYLWNPTSWRGINNARFTFEQLLIASSQTVIYPMFEPDLYKLWFPKGLFVFNKTYAGLTYEPITGIVGGSGGGNTDFEYAGEYSGEKQRDVKWPVGTDSNGDEYYPEVSYLKGLQIGANDSFTGLIKPKETFPWSGQGSLTIDYRENGEFYEGIRQKYLVHSRPVEYGDGIILNYSSSRKYKEPTIVYSFYNDIKNQNPINWYVGMTGERPEEEGGKKPILIQPNTDLDKYNTLPKKEKNKYYDIYEAPGASTGVGIHKYLKRYKNNILKEYYVPVPKGMHYIENGEEKIVQENGMFDLISGKAPIPNLGYSYYKGLEEEYYVPRSVGNEIKIYRKDQNPIKDPEYYYFENKPFDTTNCNYSVIVNKYAMSYDYPDKLARANWHSVLEPGTIFPVTKTTADEVHGIKGQWFYSEGKWYSGEDVSIHIDNQYGYQHKFSTPYKKEVLVMYVPPNVQGGKDSQAYGRTNPDMDSEEAIKTKTIYFDKKTVKRTIYYKYFRHPEYGYDPKDHELFYDGNLWIPREFTDVDRTEINKTYVVVSDKGKVYSMPIEREEYVSEKLLKGDRVSVLYSPDRDPSWAYTGKGWIKLIRNSILEDENYHELKQ